MSRLSIALVFIIHTSFALAQAEKQEFKLSSVQLLDEVSQIDQILQKEHSEFQGQEIIWSYLAVCWFLRDKIFL